jgi:cysteinyl-tRNA synthetase
MENAKDGEMGDKETALMAKVNEVREGFDAAMDDDMNTANAIGQLFELVREANAALNENSPKAAISAVLDAMNELCAVLGILRRKTDEKDDEVEKLVAARAEARANKNWAESDRLRDLIISMGYTLKDTKQGQQVTKNI